MGAPVLALGVTECGLSHRPQSSSFLGFPYRILNMNPKKELLWGLWVVLRAAGLGGHLGLRIYALESRTPQGEVLRFTSTLTALHLGGSDHLYTTSALRQYQD